MKKKNYSVMGLVQKAIIDSMNFSTENGHQIFISVSPHVDGVSFHAYKDGWKEEKEKEKEKAFDFYLYTRGNLSPTVKETKKILKTIYDFIKENSNK